MTLEERIKALMEAKDEEKKDKPEDQDDEDQDDQDGSEDKDGDEDDQDEDQTQMPNEVKVNEDFSEDEYNKNHEQPGLANREDMQKGDTSEPQADQQDDAGLNDKLKAGMGNRDGEGVQGQPSAGQEESNARNNVTVQEHMEAMFAGQELSEGFKQKATTIFEAAVASQVSVKLDEAVEHMQEEFQQKLEEAVEAVQGKLVEQIDGFLDEAVTRWVSENTVALESGMKVELVNGFINGLQKLFKESYIEVPDEKLDVVEEQAKQIEDLKQVVVTLDEAHDEVTSQLQEATKTLVLEKVSSGLTVIQRQKFESLCESVAFESKEDYETKVKTIKESYFKADQKLDESVSAQPEVTATQSYADAIAKGIKFK